MSKHEVKEFNKSILAAYGLRGSEKQSPKKASNSMYCDNQGRLWYHTQLKEMRRIKGFHRRYF